MSFLYSAVKAGIEAHRDFNNSGAPTPLMREMRQPKRSLIYGPAYDLVTYIETKTRGKRVTPFVDGSPISPAGPSPSDLEYEAGSSPSTSGSRRRAPALSEIIGQPVAPPAAQAPTESPTLSARSAPPVMPILPPPPQSQSRTSTPISLDVDSSGPSTSAFGNDVKEAPPAYHDHADDALMMGGGVHPNAPVNSRRPQQRKTLGLTNPDEDCGK